MSHPLDDEDVEVEELQVPAIRVTHHPSGRTVLIVGTLDSTIDELKSDAYDELLDDLEQAGGC